MLPRDATNHDKYVPAMSITDQERADSYFRKLVANSVAHGMTREMAEELERQNLGYWAGYYDQETRERVERLFGAVHPILGSASIKRTPREIFDLGVAYAEKHMRDKKNET